MSIDFDFIQTEIPIVLTGCLPYILYIYSFRSFVLGYQTDRSLVRLFRDKHLTFLTRAHNRVMDLARLPPTAILQSLVARCRNVYFNVFTVFILYVHNLFLSCLEHQYFCADVDKLCPIIIFSFMIFRRRTNCCENRFDD